MSYGVNLFFLQFATFIQGLFAGQLLVGGIFTNFMLITVLGFIALKLFISFSLYETPLVPTRLQSIYEFFYGFILQTVCDQTGSKVGEKFMPAYLNAVLYCSFCKRNCTFPLYLQYYISINCNIYN